MRPVKMTDAEWDDFKLVTPEAVRQWVAKQAAKLRKAEEPNTELSGGEAVRSNAGLARPNLEK